jgi:hypothetical protein
MQIVRKHIQGWNPSTIDNVALSAGSILFSVIAVIVLPSLANLRGHSGWGAIVSVLISALALGLIVRTIQRVLLNMWSQPIRGTWTYESTSGNWGLARIQLSGSGLKYTVDLYPDEVSVRAAANNEYKFGEKVLATVVSISVEYAQGKVSLIYIINLTDEDVYAPREGILKLVPLPGGMAMKGYWKSDVEGEKSKHGVLNLVRLEQFLASGETRLLDPSAHKTEKQ